MLMVTSSLHVMVCTWEEDGEESATQSGVNFCRVASDNHVPACSSVNFSTNGAD